MILGFKHKIISHQFFNNVSVSANTYFENRTSHLSIGFFGHHAYQVQQISDIPFIQFRRKSIEPGVGLFVQLAGSNNLYGERKRAFDIIDAG